jgi:hypothetical protein
VLIAEGTRVGKSFIGCPGLTDPLRQLAYGIHPYLTQPIKNPASWDRYFGDWAKTYPVVCTEWGANSGSPFAQPEWPTLSPQLLDYMKAHNIGQIAWSFDILDTLVKDWSWTPTSFTGYTVGVKGCGPGELVKQHFMQYEAAPPAAPSIPKTSIAPTRQINLAWTDVAENETGFKIERKTGCERK